MSLRFLALIPLAVAINLAMGQVAAAAALPLFLDTVGTILVAALAGLGPALLTGLMTQLMVGTIVSAVQLAFLPVQLAVAVYATVVAGRGGFRSVRRTLVAGLVLGVLAATMSWPISYLAFGGVTSSGVTMITTMLNGLGLPLPVAVYLSSMTTDLLDKTTTFLLVRSVLTALPNRLAARFPGAQEALGRTA